MENYTVTKLSEMYGVARNTVYDKFDETSLQQFLDTNAKGVRTLRKEGLHLFQTLLSNVRLNTGKQDANAQKSVVDMREVYESNVKLLNEQIAFYKQQLERLENEKNEITRKHDAIWELYVELTKPRKLLTWFKK